MSNDLKNTTGLIAQLQVDEIAKQLDAFTVIDVRTPIEFEVEHIQGAINIPLPLLLDRLAEVPRQTPLVVICRSGKRAESGAYLLAGQGYQPAILAGGMQAWRAAGRPIVEGKKMLSLERQIQLVVGTGVLTGVILATTVSPWFLIIPAFFGAGLTFAGLTGTCGLGLLLARAPWNKLPTQHTNAATKAASSNCCSEKSQ